MRAILSICIPVYNGGKGLYENVSQILSCKSDKIEVVVNDNCSTDDGQKRISEISDARLKIYTNEKPLHPFRNWYTALKRGSGKYVMLLRDNDRIHVDNLERFIDFLEKSNYIAIKNEGDWVRPHNGEITTAEYFYYALRNSHISYMLYLKMEFDELIPLEESFESTMSGYPQILWEIQMLSKYQSNQRRCYINSDIPIVDIPAKQEKSRTRNVMNASVQKGRPINYTYEETLHIGGCYLDAVVKYYNSWEDILKIEYFFYCAESIRATLGYYNHVYDKTHRYGVPYVAYRKKEWLDLCKCYYRDKLSQVEKHGIVSEKYKFLMRTISVYHQIAFKLCYYIVRRFYNPRYVFNLMCMKGIRVFIKGAEKTILR